MKEIIKKIIEIFINERSSNKYLQQANKICKLEDELKNNISKEDYQKYIIITSNIEKLHIIEIDDAIEFTFNFCKKLFKD